MIITVNDAEVELSAESLQGICENAWNDFIQHQTKTYPEWPVKLFYKDGHWCVASVFESYTEVASVIAKPGYSGTIIATQLFEREFPLHIALKKLDVKTLICGELIDFLRETKGIHFSEYHTHTEECNNNCGRTLYDVNITTEALLFEFFRIDKQAFEAEKVKMLKWMGL